MSGFLRQRARDVWPAVYLALSLPPVVYPTRMAMNQWLPGDRTKKKIYRKVLLLIIIIGFSLAIAMSWCASETMAQMPAFGCDLRGQMESCSLYGPMLHAAHQFPAEGSGLL